MRRDERLRLVGGERPQVAYGSRAGQPDLARLGAAHDQRLFGRAGVLDVEGEARFQVVFARSNPDRPRPGTAHRRDRLRNTRQRLFLGPGTGIVSGLGDVHIPGRHRERYSQDEADDNQSASDSVHSETPSGR